MHSELFLYIDVLSPKQHTDWMSWLYLHTFSLLGNDIQITQIDSNC